MEKYYDELMATIESSGRNYDVEKIQKAYNYAKTVHEGQFRKSGEPYICHPIAVAEIVCTMVLDTDSICAALLHDTVEDCPDKVTLDDLRLNFGDDVADIVDGLTKIKVLDVKDKEETHIENIRKMLLAMNKDVRVIFIKLCDRLHNMRTLNFKEENRRREIALETMYVYAPIAHRLGMQKIKHELENLSLMYLDPIGYEEVCKLIENKFGQSSSLIDNAKNKVLKLLSDAKIEADIEYRTKSIYSLYRKMYNLNKNFEEIYDFYAIRVIVNTELECYTVLGIIHEAFKSIPGRFKDYISTPKPNLYRSLHTTVIGHEGIPFEVQIRTHEMHEVAEYGLAAHWKYKSGEKSKGEMDEKLRWIASILENNEVSQDPDEFMHSFKTDFFRDETFVFTPKGDVISLPIEANVIDFAYAIHSAVGNKMVGAKINGKIVPIETVPQTGDIIEILTSPNKGPSRDWLKIVKTSEARNKIRSWYKKEKRDENIQIGKDFIKDEIDKTGKTLTSQQYDDLISDLGKSFGITSGVDDFYNTIGFGGVSLVRLAKSIHDSILKMFPPEAPVAPTVTEILDNKNRQTKKYKHRSGIIVDGQSGCDVKFAKCCNPLPGDKVIGFITKGFGITIHKENCPNVETMKKDPASLERLVSANWEIGDNEAGGSLYETALSLICLDGIGVLAQIAALLADMRVSILSLETKPNKGKFIIYMTIGCRNVSHVELIISKLKQLSSVINVQRGVMKV